MSFYGSVYYQLVDAFTKIVLGNKGININNKFGAGSTNLEGSQAIGRKGVFGFDTGNRWIVFDENTVKDQETGKDFTICEIYHNKPDTKVTAPLNGFRVLSDEEVEANTVPVIQLEYADTFETYETKYDNAGHIASSAKKVYKLPKAEVNDRVTALEDLVGTDEDRTLPILAEAKDNNLYGYVEENTKDIATLEENVGEWGADVYNGWGIDSICALLGNFTKVLTSSSYVGYNEAKTLADILGSYPALIQLSYDGVNPTSIIDSIVRGKNQLDNINKIVTDNKANTDVQVNGFAALIGNPIDSDSVYDHIGNLYDITNWSKREDTIADAIKALETTDITINTDIGKIESDIQTINDNINNSISQRINGLENRIGIHEQNWNGTEATLKAVDEELKKVDASLSKKDEELEEQISQAKTDVLSIIGEVPTDKTVLGVIDEQDSALNTLIKELRADLGSKTGDSSAFSAIAANAADVTNIKTAIGDINDDLNEINNKIGNVEGKSLQAQIGEVGDKSLQIQINEVKDSYVQKTEMAGYLEPYAKTESLSLYATKSELADYATKSELTDALDDYLTTEVAEETYVTKSELADYATKSELDNYATKDALDDYLTTKVAEETYATAVALNDVSSQITDLVENLGMPSEYKVEGKTVLKDIFEKLETLTSDVANIKEDIVKIKGVIDTLHPDSAPNFTESENGDIGEEEEPPATE